MFRFSIRQLMLITVSIAAGLVLSGTVAPSDVNVDQVLESRLMAFLLGMISLLLSVGLVQQICWPPPSSNTTAGQRTFRRFCLALVLCGIFLGVYRTCIPYPDSMPAASQSNQNTTINSELALPLWFFSLTLAMMTAPWNSGMTSSGLAGPTKTQNRMRHKVVSAAVAVGVFIYCLALTSELAFIHTLVDIAIQSLFNGVSQGPAVGTPHYVEQFVRTPQQFRDFFQWQIFTWPFALVACFGLIGWGATLKSRWWCLVLVVFVTPACVNLCWLVSGQAKSIFQIQASVWEESSIPDAMLLGPCCLLVVVLLATRRRALPSMLRAKNQIYEGESLTQAITV